ncbi:hypothetical protein QTN25_007065 [Entamoeba marina]
MRRLSTEDYLGNSSADQVIKDADIIVTINKVQKNDVSVEVNIKLGLITAKHQLSGTSDEVEDGNNLQTFILINTKKDAENICEYLNRNNISTDNSFDRLRKCEIQLIICADVMARGIDFFLQLTL